MHTFNAAVDAVLGWYFAAFRWSPAAGLVVFSALAGVAMLWVFQKTSNQERIRAVKRRLGAHLLELRLFRDEPGVMWRAQKDLLGTNLRYIGLMLRPALFMGVPLIVLLVHLDAFYGRAPLEVGREAIVTLGLRSPTGEAPVLVAPRGIAVETPPVRVVDANEVSWRIRPVAPVSGELRFVWSGQAVEKRIEAGGGPRFVPGRRESAAGPVAWIELPYPEASMDLFGFRMHWLIWFTLLSMVAALLLKKRFKVTL